MIQGIKSTLSIFAALVVGIICPSVSSGMDLWAFSCFSYEDAQWETEETIPSHSAC